jgi:hypothetical protein
MRISASLLGGMAAVLVLLSGCGEAGGSGAAGSSESDTLGQLAGQVSAGVSREQTAHIGITSRSGAGELTRSSGVIRFGADPAEAMTDSSDGEQSVMIDGAAYLKLPADVAADRQITAPWVKLDLAGNGDLDRVYRVVLQQLRQNYDPSVVLTEAEPAATGVSVRTEQLNGHPTRHYSMIMDLRKMMADPHATVDEKQMLQQTVNAGATTQSYDVWVDADNLPVRVRVSVAMPDPSDRAKTVTSNTTTDYSDWGQPVTITAPPADQVGTLPGN